MKVRCPHCSQPIELVPDVESHSVVCPSCGSVIGLIGSDEPTATMPIAEFPALDHFELIEEVGKGQFGCVWKARDRELHRVVAIKVPHKRKLSRQEAEYFLREARAAARLSHPNIVSVHEVGVTDHSMYIVSEFIDGPSMRMWHKLRKPVAREAARVCAKTARALHYAHEQGIVHRDLKPGNIILDQYGEPHLTDFGLAKQEGAEATIAITGHVIGTPAYMAPEQIRDGHLADRRSDVYSLGVVLFELLTGQRPFVGGRRILFQQVLFDEPPTLRSLNRDIPRDLQTICLKALAKTPSDRYPTAGEFADDIERFLNNEPIHARPTPLVVRGARWVRRRPAVVSSVILALVIVLLLPFIFVNRNAGATGLLQTAEQGGSQQPAGGAESQVPAARRVRVRVVTDPPGAKIRLIPISAYTGIPEPERGFDVGVSPIEFVSLPGTYLVVAYTPDRRRFHEVYRRIPSELDMAHGVFPPDLWKANDNGTVEWSPIRLFAQEEITRDMVRVTGGSFPFRPVNYMDQIPAEIPDFYVDTTETNYAMAHRWANDLTRIRTGFERHPSHAVTDVSWGMASLLAERMGKRLLREVEYDYLATTGGTQRDTAAWDHAPAQTDKAVDDDAWDRLEWTRLSKPIVGIRSNVREWTSTWGLEMRAPASYRTVAGALPSATGSGQQKPLTQLVFVARQPNLGFRCARSAAPRLKPADFARFRHDRTAKRKQ